MLEFLLTSIGDLVDEFFGKQAKDGIHFYIETLGDFFRSTE